MNKFSYLVASIVILVAQPASAQTFTPAGTYQLVGTMSVISTDVGGSNNNCTLQITLTVPATPSSNATAVPVFLGSPSCEATQFLHSPYPVLFDPATSKLSFNTVILGGIFGNGCSKKLSGTWNNASKQVLLSLAAGSGTGLCVISGTVTGPAGLSIS